MLLVDISAQQFVPGRKKRNEACFHHLLETSAFTGGLFVNAMAATSRPMPLHMSVAPVIEGTIAGKPSTVLQPHVFGVPGPGSAEALARIAAEDIRARLGGDEYVLLLNFVDHFAHRLFDHLADAARLRVFDISDDFSTWRWREGHAFYRARMHELAARADKLLCINEHIAETFPHRDIRVFHNGTDFEHFQSAPATLALPPVLPKPAGTVYVGFIGGLIAERIDVEILRALFSRFPQHRFVFCGYVNDRALFELVRSHPGALLLPAVSYAALPALVRSFDVAIIPHVVSEFTAGNDLLKVHDYLASGVPVVTTACSNVGKFGEALTIAAGPTEFCDAVEAAIRGRDQHDPRPGLAIAQHWSWRPRVHALVPWLLDRVGAQQAS